MRPSFEATDPAGEAAEGVWPIRRRRILDWLINETRGERFIDNILVEMCKRLLAAGVPVNRSSLHFRTNHPQWIGARILWVEGMEEAKINTFAYGVETTPQFLNSPVNEIHSGANEVRKNLEDLWEGDDYPFYQELRDDGYTEYVAWPIDHTFDKRHVVTFSTNRPGGFTSEHVDFLRDLLPALTLVSEIRLKNIMARTLLQTYVGPHASEQILSGVITRGSGTTVGAAIMICDLRDFTAISDLWPRDDGYSEYIAWPIDHTFDKRHVVTFSTNRPGGFTGEHVDFLRDLLPALTLVSEIRLKNIMARTLLQTYVGPHASEQILSGVITRGSGTTVGAAIMICDLRDFTAISDLWPRDDVIQLLNDYFDAMSDPIERHGGEILKFMGDGLLAIFPLSKPSACEDLLTAIREGQEAMAKVNEQHQRLGRDPLRYGVGVHVGDVMYGNIGSRRRLDFTVIGPAVNVASRLETLTKEVRRPVLLSRAFVEMATCTEEMDNLGTFPLRGLGEPVEVFAFREKPTAGRDAA